MDFRIVNDNEHGQYAQLNAYLNGRGVPSIHNSIKELILSPILQPVSYTHLDVYKRQLLAMEEIVMRLQRIYQLPSS